MKNYLSLTTLIFICYLVFVAGRLSSEKFVYEDGYNKCLDDVKNQLGKDSTLVTIQYKK